MEINRLKELKQEALKNAIDSLARYKFMMFGYWAAMRRLGKEAIK